MPLDTNLFNPCIDMIYLIILYNVLKYWIKMRRYIKTQTEKEPEPEQAQVPEPQPIIEGE